jgi:RNA polymerase sigma-70 factor (ECF subfamily)
MVMQFANESGGARDALGELARRYWYPVYVYLRRCGHAPAAATDFARRFLRQLVSATAAERSQPAQGHYRSYLLAQLREFLASKQQPSAPSGGDDPEIPADLEERYQRDHVDAPSPEESYQRAFALQVLHRTLRRLRNEARQTGHLPMYDALEPFLAREPVPGEYEAAAAALRTRPLTIVVALKRLRQRFRELAAEELADTVATAADLAAEQDALLGVLGKTGP